MAAQGNGRMIISPFWLLAAVLTFLAGFSVLGYLAIRINRDHPPIPRQVLTPQGEVLLTGEEIMAGQHVFQKYGLMQFGTLFGHGAYLGPDFTAQYLHLAAGEMVSFVQDMGLSAAEAKALVQREWKENTYRPDTGTLVYTPAQVQAFGRMLQYYQDWFGPPERQKGLRRPYIKNPEDIRLLTGYFSWAAWSAAVQRPGSKASYTHNWPPEPLVANEPPPPLIIWSVLSLVVLLGGAGLVFFLFGRYEWLGWHRAESHPSEQLTFRQPAEVRLSPAQRATPWYFLVVAGLFLCQGLLGGVNAHYHVEPSGFYGFDLAGWLPYNISRTWHLQLALFFVATSYLAMGIFIAPMIAGREPKHQDTLAILLFGALVVVVVGSLGGEAASIHNLITRAGPWFWIGAQGWEYLDLGRLWQLLLAAGMLVWVLILFRGLRQRLAHEHPGNMPWLFFFASLAIPLFYAAGMMFGRNVNFTVADFWRFWVVHLWVEDFLELFATVTVAYVFVLLGIVRPRVAITIIYLDIILYSVGGVIGTMHHLYFDGAPTVHLGLGAFFSAMEVIPLLLLTYEGWRFMQLGDPSGERTVLGASSSGFPHKWAVMFLVAVGFWNFLGAGVFGFLINLPIVSYYEIGTQWTANHGHGAMMGVYGMLAMGFFMFVARYFIPQDKASNLAMGSAFWSLNLGLAWMLFVNLFPVGLLQLRTALAESYWQARQPDFYLRPWVQTLEWLRLPGDVLFIVGGILPVVYLAVRMFLNRKRYLGLPSEEPVEELTEAPPRR